MQKKLAPAQFEREVIRLHLRSRIGEAHLAALRELAGRDGERALYVLKKASGMLQNPNHLTAYVRTALNQAARDA